MRLFSFEHCRPEYSIFPEGFVITLLVLLIKTILMNTITHIQYAEGKSFLMDFMTVKLVSANFTSHLLSFSLTKINVHCTLSRW